MADGLHAGADQPHMTLGEKAFAEKADRSQPCSRCRRYPTGVGTYPGPRSRPSIALARKPGE